MTSFPVPAGVVVLTGFGGAPRDPQPASITVEDAGNGVVGRWPDGTEKNINAPDEAPAPRPRVLSQFEFWNLLSLDQKAAVLALRATSSLMAVWWEDYKAASQFERDHASTAEGIDVLVYEEVLTRQQADAILAAWPTV